MEVSAHLALLLQAGFFSLMGEFDCVLCIFRLCSALRIVRSKFNLILKINSRHDYCIQ